MRLLQRQHAGWAVAVVLFTVATAACRESAPRVQAADSPAAQEEYAEEAAVRCANLLHLSLPDTAITSARVVPASGAVPAYCQVLGGLETVILFEVALPTTMWNGNLLYVGGGGYNGTIPDLSHGLARGYAATGTDTGHRGDHWDASALYDDPKAQLNYAHRGAHLVTLLAKRIVEAYYGATERHSFFLGCSNGGKMGLMAVQRYPTDFDGVVVGGAVVDRTGLMMMFQWTQRALLGAEIPPYKIPAMERATRAACDARDGLEDGVIDRPDRCDFDPAVLTCRGADGPDCLTPAQVAAWKKILQGPTGAAGERLYPGYAPGHEDDYPAYITGLGVMHGYPSSDFMYMDNFMRWFVFGPHFDSVKRFEYERHAAVVQKFAKEQDAAATDLSAFRSHGGKLIVWNGWADHSTPPLRAIDYYADVRKKHGAETNKFVRLFLAPGFHHCSGGPGPNVFGSRGQYVTNTPDHDLMAAMDRWVEEGVAPDRIVATKFVRDDPALGVARTRPLCPYPQIARHTGSGSIDEAANFVCANP
jgi:feruloyl esterase